MNNLPKKLISLFLFAFIACSASMVFAEDSFKKHPFADVSEEQWYNDAVQNVWEKGIIKGVSDNVFEPQASLTRGMVLTILGRLQGIDQSQYLQSDFSDVDIHAWYGPYVAWASASGIANGVTETEFAPNAPVTRQQLATFIQRYLDANGYNVGSEGALEYIDADSIAEYAKTPVLACKNAGIMQGDNNGSFSPAKHTTRAEAAAVMTRLDAYTAGVKPDTDYTYPVFNAADQKKLTTAIHAMSQSEFEGATLAKWIYYVAFSKSFTLSGTPGDILSSIFKPADADIPEETLNVIKMIAPGLYSGEAVPDNLKDYFQGTPAGAIAVKDLLVGDILLVQKNSSESASAKMYMYNGSELVEMLANDARKTAASEILSELANAELYAVLRPSMVMSNINYSQPEKELSLTPEQEALIYTAESYLRRGDRIQYDDSNMCPYGENRWQKGVRAPEEYTLDNWGYTNCAAFVHDVYLFALDYEIGMWTTRTLIDADETIRPFYYEPTGEETDEERVSIEKKFNDELMPGDIIVYRYQGGGHTLLYIGNGTVIHSTGSSYSYKNLEETYEPTIRYKQVKDIFTVSDNRYLFGGSVTQLAIVRPLNTWTGTIPENTLNRIGKMRGVVAEKLSSHNGNMTVSPGEEMTFTFSVYNTNDYEVNLDVSDVVPEHSTYVSGAQTVDGNNLSWNITVPAGKRTDVTYTIKVDDDSTLTNGSYIYSESGKVGGVVVKCPKVYIENTLTAEEQGKISAAVKELKNLKVSDFDLVNEIYKKAFGVENILPGKSYDDITDGVFEIDTEYKDETGEYYKLGRYVLRESGTYADMVVPSLYGGRSLFIEPYGDRTRLLREKYLMVGDIVLARNINEKNLFIYTDDGLFDLNKRTIVEDAKSYLASLQGLDNYDYYYVVLRPSMINFISR